MADVLTYKNVYGTPAAGNMSSSNSFGNSGNGSGTIWGDLFGNLGSIFIGAGGLVTAIKTDPTEIARAQAGQMYIPGFNMPVRSNSVYIILAVVAALVIVGLMFMSKKAA